MAIRRGRDSFGIFICNIPYVPLFSTIYLINGAKKAVSHDIGCVILLDVVSARKPSLQLKDNLLAGEFSVLRY